MKPNEKIARDATSKICGKPGAFTFEAIEQIILAAIHEAVKVEWTEEKPTETGWWWYRTNKSKPKCLVLVYRIKSELMIDCGAIELPVKEVRGQWSTQPIKEPSDE